MRKVILQMLTNIVHLNVKGIFIHSMKVGGAILAVLSILFILLNTGANARLGMFMLIAIPFLIWGLLISLKGVINKTATQEGYAAYVNNVSKSNNPYLKPNTANEDMEAAELWFTGYIDAEKDAKSKVARN